ncbi:MAG: SAM-dependent methyltransferase [Coprococcus sp.]|nr:SAM-dependent methyltransferase [Coprococcus sp.]
MTELSRRLRAVAEMVTPGKRVADVGTDHAYVPIFLVESGVTPSAIAMDIHQGPLKRARDHIQKCGLEDRIKTRLSDGLKNLKSEEADSMIAAGMGGGLIIKILSESAETAERLDELILQPQSEIAKVRQYLNDSGWRIEREDMVLEDGKFYPLMRVVRGAPESYLPEELEFGKRLLEMRHPILRQYLEREIRICGEILGSLPAADSGRIQARREEMEQKIEKITRLLAE